MYYWLNTTGMTQLKIYFHIYLRFKSFISVPTHGPWRTKHVAFIDSIIKLSFTDWVQNVPRGGIFLNNSRWYRVTVLPIFLFVHWSSTDTKWTSFGTYIAFLHMVCFCGGKQWQTTPKNLPKGAAYQSHTGCLTGLWFLPD